MNAESFTNFQRISSTGYFFFYQTSNLQKILINYGFQPQRKKIEVPTSGLPFASCTGLVTGSDDGDTEISEVKS